MKTSGDESIRRALREQAPPLPEGYEEKIHEILRQLPEGKRAGRRRPRAAAVIVMCVLVSVAATAAATVKTYRQRLVGMSWDKMETINSRFQASLENADHYSRELSADEKDRIDVLRGQYEEDGIMPQEEIRQTDHVGDVPESELWYCYENSTFYLPEEELTDEQILQIIDFYYIRDYSVRKIQKEKADSSGQKQQAAVTEQQAVQTAVDYLARLYGLEFEPSEAKVEMALEGYSVQFKETKDGDTIEVDVDSTSGELCFLTLSMPDEPEEPMQEHRLSEVSFETYNARVKEFSRKLLPHNGLKKTLTMTYYVREKDNMMLGSIRYYLCDKNGNGFMLFQTPGEELPGTLTGFTDCKGIVEDDGKRDDEYIKEEYGAVRVVRKIATIK